MDYVFVLDISGSMANKGKLGLSTEAANAFVSSLGPGDRCEVMTFNNVPSFNFEELREVDANSKQEARQFLTSQRARGGTALRPAVDAAIRYKDRDRPLNIVILSDGMTSQNEQRELLAAINGAPEGIRVFCIGIGNEVNQPLLQQLAERAGGLAAFISQGDDFLRQAEAFRRKLVHPVATELTISIDGVEVYDNLPGALPNLFHGSPIRLVGRYKDSGIGEISIRGNVQGRPFEQVVELEFPKVDSDNPQIERMWAYSNVQTLMNKIRESGETPALKEEIVGLCEGYSIVSEYASFIVLENDQEYKRWKIERRNATRIERDRKARESTRKKLKDIREKSLSKMGPKANKKAQDKLEESVPNRKVVSKPEQLPATSTRNRDLQLGPTSQSTSNQSASDRATGDRRNRRRDGGGGAIDPITATICLSLGGAAALRRRKRSKHSGHPTTN
jgi:Ca-activated chloride channel family protein